MNSSLWFRLSLALACAVGIVMILLTLLSGFIVSPSANLVSLAIGCAVLTPVVLVLRRSRLWPQAGPWYLPASLLWGSGVSFALVDVVGENPLASYLRWPQAEMSFMGAYPEELIKGLGVVLIMFTFQGLNKPWHALITGLLVGVSFDTFENFNYALTGSLLDPVSDVQGAASMWCLRLLVGPLIHAALTGIFGYAVGQAIFRAKASIAQRIVIVLQGWLISFSLHFAFNYRWPGEAAQLIAAGILTVIAYIVVGFAVRSSLKQIKVSQPVALQPLQLLGS